jgi:hypothetical protein
MLHLAAVLLHLRGGNVTPDVPRNGAEAERNAVLAFLPFLDQFNSGQDAASVLERLEAQHRCNAELHTAMILFHDVFKYWQERIFTGFGPRKLNSFRMPIRRSAE